jgi:hypothetical protein
MRANVSNRLRLISSIQILIVLLLSSGVHTIVPPREPHEPRGNGKKLLTFKDAVSPGLA